MSFDRNVHANKAWWFPPVAGGFSKTQLITWFNSSYLEVKYFDKCTPSSYSIFAQKVTRSGWAMPCAKLYSAATQVRVAVEAGAGEVIEDRARLLEFQIGP